MQHTISLFHFTGKPKWRRPMLAFGFSFLVIFSLFTSCANTETTKELISFSFQKKSLSITIKTSSKLSSSAQVFYTLDGSTPSAESTLYTDAISLEPIEGRGCYTIKAIALQDNVYSNVYTQSFFPNEEEMVYGEVPMVVVLSGDPADFYSNETGILAIGAEDLYAALEDETLPESPYADPLRANYFGVGQEWERPVTVEIFENDGTRILCQNAGVRVTGRGTRYYEIKSLRLYARSKYGETTFSSSFFEDVYDTSNLSISPSFDLRRLDLRSGGSDIPYATSFVSDASMHTIATDAGFFPISVAIPAAVYLMVHIMAFCGCTLEILRKMLHNFAILRTLPFWK